MMGFVVHGCFGVFWDRSCQGLALVICSSSRIEGGVAQQDQDRNNITLICLRSPARHSSADFLW